MTHFRPDDAGTFHCRTCQATQTGSVGWWRLQRKGEAPLGDGDARPGYYCSMDCLTVAVLSGYGLTERQVQKWLDGDKITSG